MRRRFSLIVTQFYEHAFYNAILLRILGLFFGNKKFRKIVIQGVYLSMLIGILRTCTRMSKRRSREVLPFQLAYLSTVSFAIFHRLRVMSQCSKKVIWSKCMLLDSCYHLIVTAISYLKLVFHT